MNQNETPSTSRIVLNNPIWHALSTKQRGLAEGNDLAKRFPTDVAPLGGMRDQSPLAYKALEEIVSGGAVALFLETEPTPPRDWTILHEDRIYQMICKAPVGGHENQEFRQLTSIDIPEMLALTKLTDPGPFRTRTIELGTYLGIHDSGSLVAMAGERLHLTGFTEVSAVCTHPDFRGKGYGNILVSAVISNIMERGETPILHVKVGNTAAIRLYKKLGFEIGTLLHVAVVQHNPSSVAVPPTTENSTEAVSI
ncbi:MAG TPA: GNAT family N-acetyltransferase [Acidobacteriaceae bacterium]|jgi:ribosomal protein S18 acetylase RimI-like enzyme